MPYGRFSYNIGVGTDINTNVGFNPMAAISVPIYNLLAFSTFTGVVGLSVVSTSKATDGIQLASTSIPLWLSISVMSLWVQTASVVSVNPLVVNGPANATSGGLFLYGFTVPDWDRVRNSIRS